MCILLALNCVTQFPGTSLSFHFANSNVSSWHLVTLSVWKVGTRFFTGSQSHFSVFSIQPYCTSPSFFLSICHFHFFPFFSAFTLLTFMFLTVWQFYFQLYCLAKILERWQNTVWFVFKQLWRDVVWCLSDQCHCFCQYTQLFWQTNGPCIYTYKISKVKLINWKYCI